MGWDTTSDRDTASGRKDPGTSEAAASSSRLGEALRLLAEEVRGRLDRHPWGHLLAGRGGGPPLTVELPTPLRESVGNGRLGALTPETSETLVEAIQQVLTHRANLCPGTGF